MVIPLLVIQKLGNLPKDTHTQLKLQGTSFQGGQLCLQLRNASLGSLQLVVDHHDITGISREGSAVTPTRERDDDTTHGTHERAVGTDTAACNIPRERAEQRACRRAGQRHQRHQHQHQPWRRAQLWVSWAQTTL
jgi:hypothetical protein